MAVQGSARCTPRAKLLAENLWKTIHGFDIKSHTDKAKISPASESDLILPCVVPSYSQCNDIMTGLWGLFVCSMWPGSERYSFGGAESGFLCHRP